MLIISKRDPSSPFKHSHIIYFRIMLPLLTNKSSSKFPFLHVRGRNIDPLQNLFKWKSLGISLGTYCACSRLHTNQNYSSYEFEQSCHLHLKKSLWTRIWRRSTSSQHSLQLPESHIVAGRGASFHPQWETALADQ